MNVKIRHMCAFDAAVRLGSFVEAAGALHVTPAALSLAIRELEDSIGFKVLQRTTRRLRLTEAGGGYLAHVQRVLAELDAAERFADDVRHGQSVLRVATTQTVIATLLARTLPDLNAAYPRITLQPLDVAAGGITDALVSGAADLAIGVNLPSNDEFEARPLFLSRWFAYLGPGHRLARRKRLAWSDLAGERLSMTKAANYLKLRALLGKGVDLEGTQEATAVGGMAMASSGRGVAVFPGYVQPMARILGMRAVPIETPALPHELQIAVARHHVGTVPIREVMETLERSMETRCRRWR